MQESPRPDPPGPSWTPFTWQLFIHKGCFISVGEAGEGCNGSWSLCEPGEAFSYKEMIWRGWIRCANEANPVKCGGRNNGEFSVCCVSCKPETAGRQTKIFRVKSNENISHFSTYSKYSDASVNVKRLVYILQAKFKSHICKITVFLEC